MVMAIATIDKDGDGNRNDNDDDDDEEEDGDDINVHLWGYLLTALWTQTVLHDAWQMLEMLWLIPEDQDCYILILVVGKIWFSVM